MPYVCPFKDCSKPLEMYTSHSEWASHMEKEHTQGSDRWICMHFSHSSPYSFSSRSDFTQHICDMHSGEVDATDIQSLADDCYTQVKVFEPIDCCPICGQNSFSNRDACLRHLAEHLISLSQISLSTYTIPVDFSMDLASEVQESRTSLSKPEASHGPHTFKVTFAITSDDEEQSLLSMKELSAESMEVPPDLEDTIRWAHQVAKAGYQSRPYDRTKDEVIQNMVWTQLPNPTPI